MIGELFHFVEFNKNDVLFNQGDVSDALYVIIRGTCSIQAHLDDNTVKILGEFGPTQWIGELSIRFETKRTASVIVSSDHCVLLKLNASDFKNFLEIAPEVKNSFDYIISEHVTERLSRVPFFKGIKENKPWSKLSMIY